MFYQDSKVIEIEYRNLDGSICTERECVTDGLEVDDILEAYEAIGCEIIGWHWW